MNITLHDFLTDDEIRRIQTMWKTRISDSAFHKQVLNEVITPNMARINAALGQENDASYLAYAVEYVMGKVIR